MTSIAREVEARIPAGRHMGRRKNDAPRIMPALGARGPRHQGHGGSTQESRAEVPDEAVESTAPGGPLQVFLLTETSSSKMDFASSSLASTSLATTDRRARADRRTQAPQRGHRALPEPA